MTASLPPSGKHRPVEPGDRVVATAGGVRVSGLVVAWRVSPAGTTLLRQLVVAGRHGEVVVDRVVSAELVARARLKGGNGRG